MRCAAPVLEERALARRSSRSTNPRCQRSGKVEIAGRWFCCQHAPIWRTHYAIVERIRNIRPKRYTDL